MLWGKISDLVVPILNNWFPARLNVHHGGADKKLDFSMMLNQDSFEMQ